MRGGTDKIIEAGLNTFSIFAAWSLALLGLLFDQEFLVFHCSLGVVIAITVPVKFFLGTKKAMIYFTVAIVMIILMELIKILFSP